MYNYGLVCNGSNLEEEGQLKNYGTCSKMSEQLEVLLVEFMWLWKYDMDMSILRKYYK